MKVNTIFDRRLSLLLSLGAIAVLGSGLSAQAETVNRGGTNAIAPTVAAIAPAPVPGTAATSAAALTQSESLAPQLAPGAETTAPRMAQTDDVDPGQPTRGGSSYIGVALNLGLDGDTALGDTGFTVISKIGFTNTIAVRPSVIVEEDPTILIPITYEFSLQPVDAFEETLPIAPYAGAGIGITTGDGGEVGFLLTGGVDYSITPEFTATAAVNVGFFDDTEIGILLGVGYTFPNLFGGL